MSFPLPEFPKQLRGVNASNQPAYLAEEWLANEPSLPSNFEHRINTPEAYRNRKYIRFVRSPPDTATGYGGNLFYTAYVYTQVGAVTEEVLGYSVTDSNIAIVTSLPQPSGQALYTVLCTPIREALWLS